jgi:hypothetical protein
MARRNDLGRLGEADLRILLYALDEAIAVASKAVGSIREDLEIKKGVRRLTRLLNVKEDLIFILDTAHGGARKAGTTPDELEEPDPISEDPPADPPAEPQS